MKLLLKDEALRKAMGRNGKAYINRNYRWSIVLNKYERMFGRLRGPAAPPPREREREREREHRHRR